MTWKSQRVGWLAGLGLTGPRTWAGVMAVTLALSRGTGGTRGRARGRAADAVDADRTCETGMARCANPPLRGGRLCARHQRAVERPQRYPVKLWD